MPPRRRLSKKRSLNDNESPGYGKKRRSRRLAIQYEREGEEYVPTSSSSSSEDDEASFVHEESSTSHNNLNADDFVGDVDSSESEGGDSESLPASNNQTNAKSSSSEESEEGDENEIDSVDIQRPTRQSRRRVSTKGHLYPRCNSTHDSITKDPFPVGSDHVCFCMGKDDNEKQCFSLETLIKTSKSLGKRHWLQPPHFRTKMNDEMLEQLRLKFGEHIVNFFDESWNRSKSPSKHQMYSQHRSDEEGFDSVLNAYLYSFMGSQDLYVCPICYHMAVKASVDHAQADDGGNGNESDDEDLHSQKEDYGWLDDLDLNSADPMYTLSDLCHENDGDGDGDNEIASLQTSATFCFRHIAKLKAHLKKCHGVQDELKGLSNGNDMFKRYRIRATDGLLQSYLHAQNCKLAGAMPRYWRQGNAGLFLELVFLVDHLKEKVSPEAYLFCANIGKERSKHIWEVAAQPFVNEGEDDMDFIHEGSVDSENESSSDDMNDLDSKDEAPAGMHPEEEIVRHMRLLRGKNSDDEYSSSSSDSSGKSTPDKENSENGSVLMNSSRKEDYYTSESEEDDWVKEKRFRRFSSSLTPSTQTEQGRAKIFSVSGNILSETSVKNGSKRKGQLKRKSDLTQDNLSDSSSSLLFNADSGQSRQSVIAKPSQKALNKNFKVKSMNEDVEKLRSKRKIVFEEESDNESD